MTSHILIAEDDESTAAILQYRLEQAGYSVTVVDDGAAAVRAVMEIHPALLLLDSGLPVLSGLDALRLLRSDPATSSLQVVMLTGRDDKRDIRAATVAGADDYLIKPVEPITLLRCIARHTSVT